jgi:catechol 2,3-dioxygenase-like lactoylglutathione lyase family enzyme
MFTRIDHLVIAVPNVPQAISTYSNLGFNIYPGGDHVGLGTHCAIAFHGDQYLELIAIRDAAEHRAAAAHSAVADAGLDQFIADGGGIRAMVLACDDLAAEVAAMRGRGVEVSDPETVERVLPDGRRLRSLVAVPAGLPLQFVQHLDDLDTRRAQVPERAPHPNGVLEFDRIYVAGAELESMVERYHRAFGGEAPQRLSGIIIIATMAMWNFADSQIVLAEPTGPGPTRSALESRGEGPFQVIHKTINIHETSAYLTAHGIAPAAGGRRSTGEMVAVVGAADALGCNQGFAGPES